MFQVRTLLLGAVLVGAMSGCADVVRPPLTDVRLTAGVSSPRGSPSDPVELNAAVRNAGETRVWHIAGCGCDPIGLEVLGPDGLPVAIDDPTAIGPLCPCGNVPLERGGTLGAGKVFSGTLYVTNSIVHPTPTYPAPNGTYTVVARFSYGTSDAGGEASPSTHLERRVTFDWEGSAPASAR